MLPSLIITIDRVVCYVILNGRLYYLKENEKFINPAFPILAA
jgi:hypothetical protein